MKKLFVEPYLEIVDICSLAYTTENSISGGNYESNYEDTTEEF